MPRTHGHLSAGFLLLAVLPCVGAPPWQAVRSVPSPQATVAESHQRPIHYPHRATARPDEPEPADRLMREFLDLHTAMRYEEAAEVARRAVAASPGVPTAHYNLACVLARLHRSGEAIEHLEQAVECGWRDAVHLVLDPDLAAVRRTAQYPALLDEMRRLVTEETASGLLPDVHAAEPAGPAQAARPDEAPPAHL